MIYSQLQVFCGFYTIFKTTNNPVVDSDKCYHKHDYSYFYSALTILNIRVIYTIDQYGKSI